MIKKSDTQNYLQCRIQTKMRIYGNTSYLADLVFVASPLLITTEAKLKPIIYTLSAQHVLVTISDICQYPIIDYLIMLVTTLINYFWNIALNQFIHKIDFYTFVHQFQ
jgi:hypothetical protein